MKHHSYTSTIKELPESCEVEITSSVSAEEFGDAIAATLLEFKKDVTIQGFRKGAAPEKLVRDKIGEAALLSEAAEHAISHAYGHILESEKIDAIGAPQVSITKIAEGNPLEFKIVTAVLPVIKKFDYKKIAIEENKKPIDAVTATDEELEKEKAKMKEMGHDDSKVTKEDFIKAKEYRAKEKKRLELVDALVKELDIIIPSVLIESELKQMVGRMKADIEGMGLSFADYLKHLNKTEDELKTEWRADATKRVKLDFIIDYIAEQEKISADKEKVAAEVKTVKETHKDIDEERAAAYFSHIFLNQEVFAFLEKQK